MVQKTLRTMQDDIKEAREKLKKPAFGFMKKKEEAPKEVKKPEEILNTNIVTPENKKPEIIISPEKIENQEMPKIEIPPIKVEKNIQEKETRVETIIPAKAEVKNITEVLDKENTRIQKKEEIKPVNFETVIKNTEEIQKEKPSTEIKEKDKELESLTQRISSAMNQTVPSIKKEEAPKISDKDSELKELISRMSNNLKETNEELQGLTEQLAESEAVIEKLQEQNLDDINQKTDDISTEVSKKPKEIQAGINKEPLEEKEQVFIKINQEETGKAVTEETKKEKTQDGNIKTETPYWSKLHKALKSEPEKEIKTTPEVIKEEEKKAQEGGIIKPKQIEKIGEIEEEQIEEGTPKTKLPNFYDNYINPENRLVFGKQEYYSSIHKKIKPKSKKENLEQFKDTFKSTDTPELMTDAEEKMKLRRRIAKKYGINLDALPWKKIVVGSVVFLTVWGMAFMYITKKVQPPVPEEIVVTEGKSIEVVDKKIDQEVTTTQNQVSGINYFDAVLDPWKNFSNATTTRLRIIQNNKDTLLTKDEALKTILGEENFNNIPQDFKTLATEEYNVLVFKNNNDIRLGIAFRFDQSKKDELEETMINWERTSAKKQKIYNVMKALFVKTKTTETEQDYFNSANYKEVNLKYVNIPDTNTSMDYFIVDDIIVFTTSKDTTIAMINFLKQ